jgi:hypothetical protein
VASKVNHINVAQMDIMSAETVGNLQVNVLDVIEKLMTNIKRYRGLECVISRCMLLCLFQCAPNCSGHMIIEGEWDIDGAFLVYRMRMLSIN